MVVDPVVAVEGPVAVVVVLGFAAVPPPAPPLAFCGGALGGAALAASACWRECWTAAGSRWTNLSAALELPTEETARPTPKKSGPTVTSPLKPLSIGGARMTAERKRKSSGPRKRMKPIPWRIDE